MHTSREPNPCIERQPRGFVKRLRMRLLLPLLLFANSAVADESARFLDSSCLQGFAKTSMPKGEAARFCTCVTEDVAPRLSGEQRRTLAALQAEAARGRNPPVERLATSGVRDLVVAGQARCEAAFYPPSSPINIAAGSLQLTLRCEDETKKPEAFVYGRGMALLSKAEMRAIDQRMMKGRHEPAYATVVTAIDGGRSKVEKWEIDLTGEIISPPNASALIEQLRNASSVSVAIERGAKRHAAAFTLSGNIPARWAPCGGVGK
jgi:hypothetical protein